MFWGAVLFWGTYTCKSHCSLAYVNIWKNLLLTGWPHFWETKFPEFSLSFPGYFKPFPWATQERKIRGVHFCWRSCHIFFIFPEFSRYFLQKLKFPWLFPEILTIFQIPWVFQVFHVFGHPVLISLSDKAKITLFSKLSNFDVSPPTPPPPPQADPRARQASDNLIPGATRMCEPGGMVRLGID